MRLGGGTRGATSSCRRSAAVLAGALALAPVSAAHAQVGIVSSEIPEDRMGASFGWDPTWLVGLGYAHRVPPLGGRYSAQVDAVLAVPLVLIPELNAGKLTGGVQALLLGHGRLGTVAGAHTGLTLANDPTGTKVGWGLELNVQPGYFAPTWSIAIDLAWRTALATYIAHAERVRDTFDDRYPDGAPAGAQDGPRDGWYFLPANRFHVGAAGGFVIAARTALSLAGGFDYTPQVEGVLVNPAIGGMPFYARLEGDYRW